MGDTMKTFKKFALLAALALFSLAASAAPWGAFVFHDSAGKIASLQNANYFYSTGATVVVHSPGHDETYDNTGNVLFSNMVAITGFPAMGLNGKTIYVNPMSYSVISCSAGAVTAIVFETGATFSPTDPGCVSTAAISAGGN
jgi:ABC-type amino acid transport substrate-binding protein